jgi:hypothetical protein
VTGPQKSSKSWTARPPIRKSRGDVKRTHRKRTRPMTTREKGTRRGACASRRRGDFGESTAYSTPARAHGTVVSKVLRPDRGAVGARRLLVTNLAFSSTERCLHRWRRYFNRRSELGYGELLWLAAPLTLTCARAIATITSPLPAVTAVRPQLGRRALAPSPPCFISHQRDAPAMKRSVSERFGSDLSGNRDNRSGPKSIRNIITVY